MTELAPLNTSASARTRLGVLLGVWASLLIVSLLRAPIPGINEAHYLTKAKHYWQPEWAARDFFLNTADAHLVFYQVFGPLTVWFDFPTAALIGRLLGYGLVALGWCRLVRSLSPDQLLPLWSAWLWMPVAVFGEVSGEWVIGGIEGKIPAYGCTLLGLSAAVRLVTPEFWTGAEPGSESDHRFLWREWLLFGTGFGMSIAFHPVVGVWWLAGMTGGVLCVLVRRSDVVLRAVQSKAFLGGLLLLIGCASWGVLPTLAATATPDPNLAADAYTEQVFGRLRHHLDPYVFLEETAVRFLSVLAVGLAAASLLVMRRASSGWVLLLGLVGTGLLIAGISLLIARGPRPWPDTTVAARRAWWLRFYWFRLIDAALPMVVGILIPHLLASGAILGFGLTRRTRSFITTLTLVPLLLLIQAGPIDAHSVYTDYADEVGTFDEWVATCAWVGENTPANAKFLTPLHNYGFKWYAGRAESVTLKDMPQDPESLVAWRELQREYHTWAQASKADGFTRAELSELATLADCEYFIADPATPKLPLDVIYENESFTVYELPGGRTEGRRE